MDDIKAFMNGRNEEFVEMSKNVSRKLNEETEEKPLKLSITEEEWK